MSEPTGDTQDPRRVLRPTSLRLPQYVWDQVEAYLKENPDIRFRQLVMKGFEQLDMKIDPEDLVAQRRSGWAAHQADRR